MPPRPGRVREYVVENTCGNRSGGRRARRSGVQIALSAERKRVEVLMAIEGIGVFGPLEPIDDQVGQWRCDHLITDFKAVAGRHRVQENSGGIDAAEGEGDDKNGVYGLADDSGSNCS